MSEVLIDSESGISQIEEAYTTPREALMGDVLFGRRVLPAPAWFEQSRKQLTRLLLLPENWDSYGAVAPLPETVQSSYGFLMFVVRNVAIPLPYISATPNGGVFFLWKNGSSEIEVDIVSPSEASYLYENTDTGEYAEDKLIIDNADKDGIFLHLLHDHFEIS